MSIPESPPLLIGVMGVTGAGKSHFIQKISGDKNIVTSRLMGSCTKVIQSCVEFEIDGRRVQLVDTPGFGDAVMTNTEVLNLLYEWFQGSFTSAVKLHGLIYLHNINEQRINREALTSLGVFGDVCGPDFLKNTVLVTTKWDRVHEDDQDFTVEVEKQLKEDYWKQYLTDGALYSRSPNTPGGCKAIVGRIVKNAPKTSQLEKEVKDGVKLGDTTAGATLEKEIRIINEENERKMKDLEKKLEAARAEDNRKAAENLQLEVNARLAQAEKNKKDLLTLQTDNELRFINSEHSNLITQFNCELKLQPNTARATNFANFNIKLKGLMRSVKDLGDQGDEGVKKSISAIERDSPIFEKQDETEQARLRTELAELDGITKSQSRWHTRQVQAPNMPATDARATEFSNIHDAFVSLRADVEPLVLCKVVGVEHVVKLLDTSVATTLAWVTHENKRIKDEQDKIKAKQDAANAPRASEKKGFLTRVYDATEELCMEPATAIADSLKESGIPFSGVAAGGVMGLAKFSRGLVRLDRSFLGK